MNTKIQRARDKVETAKEVLNKVCYAVICKCKHEHVGECHYIAYDYGHHAVPLRMCLDCGLVEDGWGPGYCILTVKAVELIVRDAIYVLRTVHIYNADKEPLIRKEISVPQLVASKLNIPYSGDT